MVVNLLIERREKKRRKWRGKNKQKKKQPSLKSRTREETKKTKKIHKVDNTSLHCNCFIPLLFSTSILFLKLFLNYHQPDHPLPEKELACKLPDLLIFVSPILPDIALTSLPSNPKSQPRLRLLQRQKKPPIPL